ncbi:MAG TPA: hypothetical protein PLT65_02755 [Bacilli bacterium]|nr:hypothetical protein [Bacilli bacterium]
MNKEKLIKYLILIIIILFTGIFLITATGYYEIKNKERMILTNEQILKFEQDIAEGLEVDIEDYLVDEYIDYSNLFSKRMNSLSSKIEGSFEKIIIFIFNEVADTIEKG